MKYAELLKPGYSGQITYPDCQRSIKALKPNEIVRLARGETAGDVRVRLVGQNIQVGKAGGDGLVHASLRIQTVDRGAYLDAQFHALY